VQNRSGAENEQDSEQEPFVRSLFQFDAMHGATFAVWSISLATYARAPVENKQKVTEHFGNGSRLTNTSNRYSPTCASFKLPVSSMP
jgi:hypothetical protein